MTFIEEQARVDAIRFGYRNGLWLAVAELQDSANRLAWWHWWRKAAYRRAAKSLRQYNLNRFGV